MKPWVSTYLKFFGYSGLEYMPCECGCGRPVVDIHHLTPRSIAPKHKVNLIDNLCGLSRECHEMAHKDKSFNDKLKFLHRKKLLSSKHDNERIIYYDHRNT